MNVLLCGVVKNKNTKLKRIELFDCIISFLLKTCYNKKTTTLKYKITQA